MLGTSTVISAIGDLFTSLEDVFIYALPIIVGALAALLALGWTLRFIKKHITGRKA